MDYVNDYNDVLQANPQHGEHADTVSSSRSSVKSWIEVDPPTLQDFSPSDSAMCIDPQMLINPNIQVFGGQDQVMSQNSTMDDQRTFDHLQTVCDPIIVYNDSVPIVFEDNVTQGESHATHYDHQQTTHVLSQPAIAPTEVWQQQDHTPNANTPAVPSSPAHQSTLTPATPRTSRKIGRGYPPQYLLANGAYRQKIHPMCSPVHRSAWHHQNVNEGLPQEEKRDFCFAHPPEAITHGISVPGSNAIHSYHLESSLFVLNPFVKVIPCYNMVSERKYDIVCQNMTLPQIKDQIAPSESLGFMMEVTWCSSLDKICWAQGRKVLVSDDHDGHRLFFDLYTKAQWLYLEKTLVVDTVENLFARRAKRKKT